MGIWATLFARGIIQGTYQNWKWPLEVIRELKVRKQDFCKIIFR